MAWEKNFDVDDVLDRAAEVFSIKGFEATSIADLVKGMGVNRGSLYATFGNKHDLFKAVLTRFVEDHQARTLAQLDAMGDPVAAITGLFDAVLTQSVTDKEKKGNLVITGALEFPNHEEDIQQIVTRALGKLEAFFTRRIDAAKASGQIDADTDTKNAARSLVALTVGFRVLARGAYDAEALRSVKGAALRVIGVEDMARI